MKRFLSIFIGIGAMALVMAVPVHADMIVVADTDLDAISGKGQIDFSDGTSPAGMNNFLQAANSDVSNTATGDNNIGFGSFQWHDLHTTDASMQKGANYFNSEAGTGAAGSGSVDNTGSNQAQQNVVAIANSITWGARASGLTLIGTVANAANSLSITGADPANAGLVTQTSVGHATMALGGF